MEAEKYNQGTRGIQNASMKCLDLVALRTVFQLVPVGSLVGLEGSRMKRFGHPWDLECQCANL